MNQDEQSNLAKRQEGIASKARQLEEDPDFKRAEEQNQKEHALLESVFRKIFGGQVGWIQIGRSEALGVVDVQAGFGPNPFSTRTPFVLDKALSKTVRDALEDAGTI